jgi:hypothetical protein
MSKFLKRLSFEQVASEIGCGADVVRALVVEEKRLAAIYVSFMGLVEPYDNQVINVGDIGQVFDLARGFAASEHIGYLRVERTALEEFRESNPTVIGAFLPEVKPLATRERDTLLTIIAVLCKEAKLDYTKHAKIAGLIQSTAATMGVAIGETTIEGHLKKIPNALVTRMK